jgi:hypothetical protein
MFSRALAVVVNSSASAFELDGESVLQDVTNTLGAFGVRQRATTAAKAVDGETVPAPMVVGPRQ